MRTNGIRLRQAYGATGSMGHMGLMGDGVLLNDKPPTANCKLLTANRLPVLAPITWGQADVMLELPRQMIRGIETENDGDFLH